MKMNTNPEWLLRMAEKEANRIISVGGFVNRVEMNVGVQSMPAMTRSEWTKIFPVSVMRKLRFSLPEGVSDVEALLQFFGVASPDAWRSKWGDYAVAFRQTQKFDFHREALTAWVREAEIIAGQIPLADFDEEKLRGSLDEFRRLTREDTQVGLDRAQLLCAKAGVALVLVPELPGTRISGCARWLNDRHAMIGLTVRYKWADQLWFTFYHEVAHVLLHRRRLFVIDNAADHMGDAVVDPVMAKYEEEADRFAGDLLIPPVALAEFLSRHGETLTSEEIHAFADSIEIGPGMVVGRLQHDEILKHWQGNMLRQKLGWDFVTED
ncbi:ImmA/IrrE family metallo-endopeptidase [Telmatocola sphagniphila]|uniref:ImmA/IrrE family metallo-endopeptidase n=1 Tax=Telmatocola sphagniphila TaxID=1123043 RepID=A0A8E6ETI6_9BACT|nr:ImmA/IrrE family metallo-endopeptidase [Telmatocola sphagniphila]QVL32479.1 ImmA/IrrE family metallo-endopeptidase [Telmatocola sphagniphila]